MSHADQPDPRAEIDELEADIEQTRAELGETVAALTDKLDVKGRAEQKVQDVKEDVKAKVDTAKDNTKDVVAQTVQRVEHPRRSAVPWVIAGAVVLAGVLVWARRR